MLGSNLVPFDQIKLQKVETGIYTNDPLAAVVRMDVHPWPGAVLPCSPVLSVPFNVFSLLSMTCTGRQVARQVLCFFILQCGASQLILLDGTLAVHLLLLCTLSELNVLFEIP